MALNKIVDATSELFTLAEAKHHLNESQTANARNAAYIGRLLATVRQAAEEATHQTLLRSTYRLTLDAFPYYQINLERGPVSEVVSVKYTDAAGVEQTMSPALYQVALSKNPGLLVPAYGQLWPSTRCELEAVRVEYKAGRATAAEVPLQIRQWALLVLTDLYQNRGASSDKPLVRQQFVDMLLDGQVIWSV